MQLPNSTDKFRFQSTIQDNEMTIATWLYWRGLDGILNDFAIWDEQLSSEEIAAVYNLAADVGMGAGMANTMFGIYDAAGAVDSFVNGSGWYAWYDSVDRGLGAAGTVTYLGYLDSIYGCDYSLAPKAHYYYLNRGSGVVFAIPEPASLTLLALGCLGLLRRRQLPAK